MDFGTFFMSYRRNLHLSLTEFLAGVGEYVPAAERFTVPTVSRWEHGKYTPPVTWLFYLLHHAPDGSWQRDFAGRSLALLEGNTTDKGPAQGVSINS